MATALPKSVELMKMFRARLLLFRRDSAHPQEVAVAAADTEETAIVEDKVN